MIDWSSLGTQEFLSFDSDLDLAEARRLTGQVDPEYIVIRRAAPIGEYFVVPTADLDDDDDLDHDGTLAARTIGDLIDDRFMRAIVIDTDDGWIHADPPTDTGALYDAVVLGDDGIVSGVVPAFEVTISPPPGESAASDVATGIPGVPMLFDWRHLRAIPKKFPGIVVGPSLVLPSPVDAAGHRALGIDTITTPTERSGFGFAGGDGGPGDGGGSGGGGGGGGGDSDGGGDGREDGGDGQPDGGVPMALDVQFPDTVQLGATASVLVLLTLGQGGPGSAPISAVDGEVLEIMVSPTVGFTLASAPSQPMTVRVVDETLPVRFELTADVLGKGVAKVYAFRGGGCVASLTVSANIIATPVVAAATPPAILTVPAATGTRADLDLTVFKESYRGGTALRYRLSDARQNVVSEFGPVGLDTDPSGFVHSDFAEIQRLNRRGATWGTAEQTRLGRIGAELYELLVPSDLQEVLWGTTRVRSLLVQTEEPWIPWELCRMTRKDQSGRISSRGFLCELFDMSRWLPGITMKPNLTASRIGVIAPTDSALPSRRDEVAMIDGLGAHGPDVEQIPATYSSVVAALEGHRYDVIHFIGHGQNVLPDNASRSEIVLSGRWRLTPSDISGETRNLGMASPVVFMNACEVAQASMALHGIGGWASVLTRAGAGAVIGTHWDVRDDLAHRFSTAFYDAVVGGSTIAAATRSARDVIRARADCDATWLAYSVHAAPDATCSFAAPDR